VIFFAELRALILKRFGYMFHRPLGGPEGLDDTHDAMAMLGRQMGGGCSSVTVAAYQTDVGPSWAT